MKWEEVKKRPELSQAGVYLLTGYASPGDELPTLYIGQADLVRNRIEEHIKGKDFWDRAVVFVFPEMAPTYAKWLEYALLKRASEVRRTILHNAAIPKEPPISEPEKAEMEVFLTQIYQTLPIVGVHAFEVSKPVVRTDSTESVPGEKDTIVVPGHEDGFVETFIGEKAWWAVRISGGMLQKIRYIAIYRTAPVSAVTHYAVVASIEPYGEEGKYKLLFSGEPKELESPIPMGDSQPAIMMGPKYTSFSKLKSAGKVADLFS